MKSDDYIEMLRKANPTIFKAWKIQIRVSVLEEQIREAFEAGSKESMSKERVAEEASSLFGSLFGSLSKPLKRTS